MWNGHWLLTTICVITLSWDFTLINAEAGDASLCPVVRGTYRMTSYRDRCLQFGIQERTWVSARDYCSQNGGRLLKIEDQDMRDFVQNNLAYMTWNTEDLWIGLNDRNGDKTWSWVGGFNEPDESLTWRGDWKSGFPREPNWYNFGATFNCAVMHKQSKYRWIWENNSCNLGRHKFRFICEYPHIPTTPVATTSTESLTTVSVTTEATTESATTDLDNMEYTTKEIWHNGAVNGDQNKPLLRINGQNSHEEDHVTTPQIGSDDSIGGSNMQSNVERHHQETESKQIPLYAIILAFIAGVSIACVIAFLVVCRRKKKQKKEKILDEVYLTTKGICPKEDRPNSDGSTLTRAVSNDYVSDEDMAAVKEAIAATPDQSPTPETSPTQGPPLATFVNSVRNPTLEGSLRRGKLPEVPTDGGYEIPVDLVKGTWTQSESSRKSPSPTFEASPDDAVEPDSAQEDSCEEGNPDDCHVVIVSDQETEQQEQAAQVYQVIPVDEDTEEIKQDEGNVYQSIA